MIKAVEGTKQKLSDYCEVNRCSNGGICVMGAGEPFICICPDGFTGDTCNETETGPCNPNPCTNDGACAVTGHRRRGDVFSEYVCRCQPGFDGVHCQNSKPLLNLSSVLDAVRADYTR
ncbi:unnamed protein product [Merluccius merluccius]